MSCFPRKPQRGDKALQALYDSVCQIIDFLPSLEVRGDSSTIKVSSLRGGKIIEAIRQTSGSQSAGYTYDGPFAFTYDDNGSLIIKEGFLSRNGELVVVPEKNMGKPENLSEGFICIFDELTANGSYAFKWSEPEFKIEKKDKIDNRYYPLGEVTIDKETQKKSIKCFATPVAILLIGKDCIIEEKK
jgi:hypothetical protein